MSFSEQIIPKDKYLSIFLLQMPAIVYSFLCLIHVSPVEHYQNCCKKLSSNEEERQVEQGKRVLASWINKEGDFGGP